MEERVGIYYLIVGVLAFAHMSISLPTLDDWHVHLRQGSVMPAYARSVTNGGAGRVLVMPNLSPPITTVQKAVEYRNQLIAANPHVEYFMTLYLSPELTVEDLRIAKSHNVIGVKSYPKGVTTGSDAGVEGYDKYYEIFSEMENLGISLHLHGETPYECVLQAEEHFVKSNLIQLHRMFPKLKIVLEHVTTEAAINAVLQCGDSVAATVTVHHLDLTISDVVGNNVNFCKPVAKLVSDRTAIRNAVASGHPKFFLGSDSAPHPLKSKSSHCCAPAGIFTQDHLALYLADAFDRMGCLDKLENFACFFGARFLGIPKSSTERINMKREAFLIPSMFEVGDEDRTQVVPFRAGQSLRYSFSA